MYFDTAEPDAEPGSSTHAAREELTLPDHSMVVLKRADDQPADVSALS